MVDLHWGGGGHFHLTLTHAYTGASEHMNSDLSNWAVGFMHKHDFHYLLSFKGSHQAQQLSFWHPPGPFLLAKQDNIMPTPSSSYAQNLLTSDDFTDLNVLGVVLSVRDIICA